MRVDTSTGPSEEKQIPLDCAIMGFSERAIPLEKGKKKKMPLGELLWKSNIRLTHPAGHIETGAKVNDCTENFQEMVHVILYYCGQSKWP